MAEKGLRVLAFAWRALPEGIPVDDAEEEMTLAGLVGLEDPPRPEVAEALHRCHEAGIKVIMVTGDHPHTAIAIAREIGLVRSASPVVITGEQLAHFTDIRLQLALNASEIIFARVQADQKMRIVAALKNKGEIVAVTGLKSEKWIGIAPFAQYDSKVYPKDLMQQVIDALASDSGLKVLLFGGGEKEIQLLNQLQNNHSNVVVLAGKLKLKQELEVISNLDVMLSMDSGNAHLAAMLGVKVITLWGATHPFAGFKPFNQPDDFCITADRKKYPLLPTSVYGNKKVDGYEDAMRTILPETVVNKIKKEL